MLKKNIIINSLKVAYYQSHDFSPEGPLIFLHGWRSRALHLNNILEQCRNFIALDLPGFGESELPRDAWRLAEFSGFLKNFLDKLKISRPVLAGHSFGGAICLKYAALGYPAEKLILIDASGIRKKSVKKYSYYFLAKIFKLFFYLPGLKNLADKARKKFYKKIDSTDYLYAGEHKKIYQKIIREDLTKELLKITRPTIIIWGENDADTPLEDGHLMNKLIKNSRLFTVKQAGHWPFLERKNEFNKIFFSAI